MKTTLQVRMAKQNFQFTLITFFVWIVNVLFIIIRRLFRDYNLS